MQKIIINQRVIKILSEIDYLRGRIAENHLKGVFVPVIEKESAIIMAYASTTIEGSTLSLQEVRQVADGGMPGKPGKHIQMVRNYLDAVRWIRQKEKQKTISEKDILYLHKLIGENAVEGGPVGQYRKIQVYVGDHTPPVYSKVSPLMKEFIKWLNGDAKEYHPVVSSAIVHFEIATIHPFRDGNGRVARALASWELYRRGFDTLHIFTLDDILLENRQLYYSQLSRARKPGGFPDWIEYISDITAEGLERSYNRLKLAQGDLKKLPAFSDTQKQILSLLSTDGPQSIAQLMKKYQISRQGVYKALGFLLKTKRIVPVGTRRSRRYSVSV
ncbi:MAG: Fic family protein [Elusimicrobia bacterium]|nr:Fic family protein [Candidatus Liberimonas magnetica]